MGMKDVPKPAHANIKNCVTQSDYTDPDHGVKNTGTRRGTYARGVNPQKQIKGAGTPDPRSPSKKGGE